MFINTSENLEETQSPKVVFLKCYTFPLRNGELPKEGISLTFIFCHYLFLFIAVMYTDWYVHSD